MPARKAARHLVAEFRTTGGSNPPRARYASPRHGNRLLVRAAAKSELPQRVDPAAGAGCSTARDRETRMMGRRMSVGPSCAMNRPVVRADHRVHDRLDGSRRRYGRVDADSSGARYSTALVHQRGRVDRDLPPMRTSGGAALSAHLLSSARSGSRTAAGAVRMRPAESRAAASVQALVDGVVLAVHRRSSRPCVAAAVTMAPAITGLPCFARAISAGVDGASTASRARSPTTRESRMSTSGWRGDRQRGLRRQRGGARRAAAKVRADGVRGRSAKAMAATRGRTVGDFWLGQEARIGGRRRGPRDRVGLVAFNHEGATADGAGRPEDRDPPLLRGTGVMSAALR